MLYNRFVSKSRMLYRSLLDDAGFSRSEAAVFLLQLIFLKLAEANNLFLGKPIVYAVEKARLSSSNAACYELSNTLSNSFACLPEGLNVPLPYTLPTDLLESLGAYCSAIDWTSIDISVASSYFEAAHELQNSEAVGSYYTSAENVDKLLTALCFNQLQAEAEQCQSKLSADRFLSKLRSLRFLDASSGSGNFLVSAYKKTKTIELSIAVKFKTYVGVTPEAFYGIEIDETAARNSQILMLLQQRICEVNAAYELHDKLSMMDMCYSPSIVCDNALRTAWPSNIDYIIGNPPFVSRTKLSESQLAQLSGLTNVIDYSQAWIDKAGKYMLSNRNTRAAMILPNSVCQGTASIRFWEAQSMVINFAYQSMKWADDVQATYADVWCVIVGFSYCDDGEKLLHTISGTEISCPYINYYLQPSESLHENIDTNCCRSPLLPPMKRCTKSFKIVLATQRNTDTAYVRYITADNLLNSVEQYVELDSVVYESIISVTKPVIIIPRHCSENRRYIPMAYIQPSELDSFVCNESVLFILGADLNLYALLQSAVHQDYIQAYCGRLGMRYRYSSQLYDSFYVPKLTEEQITVGEALGAALLEEQSKVISTSGLKLGNIYRTYDMPAKLLKKHLDIDKYFDLLYFGKIAMSPSERVRLLKKCATK